MTLAASSAEVARTKSDVEFRSLLEKLPAAAYTADVAGLITYFNTPAVKLWGREPKLNDPADRYCGSFKLWSVDGAPISHDRCWMALALKDGKQYNGMEIVLERLDGSRCTALAHANPIRDEAGQITGAVNVLVDITERKQIADELAAEREFMQRTIQRQDRDRQLLAYEIHDGLVQYVTAAKMYLEAGLASPGAAGEAQMELAMKLLRRAMDEGRRLINGIRTPVLDGYGVVPAIEQLIADDDRLHVDFVKDPRLTRLAAESEEALFRIAQEALTNARKHSRADRARIELGLRGDQVRLCIQDSGVGFENLPAAQQVHGLKGMAERAKLVGGRCTIESAHGQGTKVIVELPYVPRPANVEADAAD